MAQRTTPTRRPRDRRQQIIASAALQFRSAGYHNVGITEIAEAVGITSGALYRHFSGKQDLLFAAVEDTVERLHAVWAHPDSSLTELLDATCALVTHGPHLGALWGREMAHLTDDQQRELRSRLLAAIEPVRATLAQERPDLSSDGVDLLLWAAVGVIGSAGFYTLKIDPDTQRARLLEGCLAVCNSVTVDALDAAQELDATFPLPDALLPASRQEAILAAATRLFSTRGYQAVGVDDIGAVAGITGATVYHHYPNKAAILRATLLRGLQSLLFDLSGALESSTEPAAALAKLVHFYTRTSVEHGRVIAALRNEAINLPTEDRRILMQAQVDYLAEWVALLTGYRPDLSDREARVLVEATTASIGSILAVPHLRRRPTLRAELESIGRAILGIPTNPPGRALDPHAGPASPDPL